LDVSRSCESELRQVVHMHIHRLPLSPAGVIWYCSKQVHRSMHCPPVSGLAASADVWLRNQKSAPSCGSKWLGKDWYLKSGSAHYLKSSSARVRVRIRVVVRVGLVMVRNSVRVNVGFKVVGCGMWARTGKALF